MITPEQARAFTPNDEAAAAKHEAYIDSRLKDYDTRPIVCIVDCSRRVAAFLAERYKRAGWLVDLTTSPDQRGPGYVLTFTIPSPPRSGPGVR